MAYFFVHCIDGNSRRQIVHKVGEDSLLPQIAGELSEKDLGRCLAPNVEFCSWQWAQAYPEFFIRDKDIRAQAQPHFDLMLKKGNWDFFCLFNPEDPNHHPRLMIPTLHFEVLLRKINNAMGMLFRIPSENQSEFRMTFGEGGTPRPRFVKRSERQDVLTITHWPETRTVDAEAFHRADRVHKQSFRDKLERMVPRYNKIHTNKPQEWSPEPGKRRGGRGLRERRFLGEDMLMRSKQYLHLAGSYEGDVLFVCMDVELLEVAPRPVTEIGISFLDVALTRNIWPGPGGRNWLQLIKSHHLRSREYSDVQNYRFVKGCPDKFDFGFVASATGDIWQNQADENSRTSQFPSLAELSREIDGLLKPYTDKGRRLVFAGHSMDHDIEFLKKVGVYVSCLDNLVGKVDSQLVHLVWRKENSLLSLESILDDLGIYHQNLHNAGNDAFYTLCALIGVAVEHVRARHLEARGQQYIVEPFPRDIPGMGRRC